MRNHGQHETAAPEASGPGRLEAFSDGIIAVIITIMVLDLRVPAGNSPRDLLVLWPTVAAYLASFFFVAVYWVNHHQLIRGLGRVDFGVLWANIVWLLTLSVIPFFTSYVGQKSMTPFSIRLYDATLLTCAMSFLLLRFCVGRIRCQDGIPPGQVPGEMTKHFTGLGLYALALTIAGRWPHAAMGIIALVTALYIVPTIGLRKADRDAIG